jgi:thiamine biosynthesis lipoprotein
MKKFFTLIFLSLTFISCKNERLISLKGFIYGTTYNIQFYNNSNENYSEKIDSIFKVIDNSMSTYKSNSIISMINNNKDIDVDNHFKNVFSTSKKIYKKTNGRFDPSIGLLVNYWGFGPEKYRSNPETKTDDQIIFLFAKVGLDKFKIVGNRLKRPLDSYIDFNAIAKGYAVDEIANFLKNKQINNYLVEIGGEINASGTNINKNKPWVIAIDMPRFDGDRSIYSTLELNNISLASSGTYRKFKIDSDGNRYAHIIDPLSGYPSKTNILSVTVKASSCIEADAYATALHTMSVDEIMEFFDKNEGISSLIIFENENNQLQELVLNNFY